MGSLHECKTIEVYSKTKDSEWHQVFEVADKPENQKEISEFKKNLEDFVKCTGDKSGTLIIWKNLDK